MDRLADLVNCTMVPGTESDMPCNHGGGFLDRYDWGYTCGNCGATFVFKDQLADSGGTGPIPDNFAKRNEAKNAAGFNMEATQP